MLLFGRIILACREKFSRGMRLKANSLPYSAAAHSTVCDTSLRMPLLNQPSMPKSTFKGGRRRQGKRKPGYPFEAQIKYNGEVIVMKKILPTLLAVILALSASQTVFGATKNDAKRVIESSVSFAFEDVYGETGYTVGDSKNFYIYNISGADASAYKADYIASVKKALDEGSLSGIKDLGLVICNLQMLGENPADFYGFNIVEMLKAADVTDCSGTPYSYYYAVQACVLAGLDETEKALCEEMLGYYTLGSGTDFWGGYGTSPDDLAMFILTLIPLKADYQQYISDAFSLLEAYKTDEGYSNYGANADSTALALAAYSADGSKEKADEIYDILIENFYDEQTGGFVSDFDEYYATADAVFGISVYLPLADANDEGDSSQPVSEEKEDKPEKEEKKKTSPSTGASYSAAVYGVLALGAAALILKKRSE